MMICLLEVVCLCLVLRVTSFRSHHAISRGSVKALQLSESSSDISASSSLSSSYSKDWIRFAARVAYDGTKFFGWQTQDNEDQVRTIQGVLSNTLSKRFNRQLRVTGASRTDYGVSARGQAIHFDIPLTAVTTAESIEKGKKRTPSFNENLQYTLNRMLPLDVRIFNLTVAPSSSKSGDNQGCDHLWHATKDAVGKLYVYRFCTNEFVDPLRRHYCAHVYRKFDPNLFSKCLQAFVGTHDFAAYGNRIEHTANELQERGAHFSSIRTVHSIDLIDEGGGYWRVEIRLESALYRMCRNIIGTSLHVASGSMDYETLQNLLLTGASRNENKAKSASPEGLCLEKVYYEHDFF